MKPLKSLILLAMASWAVAGAASASEPSNLKVRAHSMRNSDGQLMCALFKGPKGFPDAEGAAQGDKVKVKDGQAVCEFKNLDPGVYAVAVFHDEDGDGEMDTILGIPTEGFGFSNDAKPGTFGPPSFQKAAFRVSGGSRAMSIKMLYL